MQRSFLTLLGRATAFVGLAATLVWATGRLALADDMRDAARAITVTPLVGWRDMPRRHVAGLRIALAPGWHTYWRSAGSTGIAPRFDWGASRGVLSVEPVWPVPRVFQEGTGLAIGFREAFLLPLIVATDDGPSRLRGTLSLGVCASVCIPVQVPISIDLPNGGAPSAVLQAALEAGPDPVPVRADCSTRPTESGLALTGSAELPPLGDRETVVFELGDPTLWVTDARVTRDGARLTARSEIMVGGGRRVALDREAVRITVIGDGVAVELEGCAR